jgi:hypothetical protein
MRRYCPNKTQKKFPEGMTIVNYELISGITHPGTLSKTGIELYDTISIALWKNEEPYMKLLGWIILIVLLALVLIGGAYLRYQFWSGIF